MTGPTYRTISDVAALAGVPHHVLRFWETKFPAVAPLKRGGNRRYYRPEDVAAVLRIARLLQVDGYTIKGAQKLLAEETGAPGAPPPGPVAVPPAPAVAASVPAAAGNVPVAALAAIRAELASALAAARAMPRRA